MPPETRGCKVSKASKENIDVNSRIKLKSTNKDTKSTRKALADKTNSASDDNATVVLSKPKKIPDNQVIEQENLLVKQRPRRDRRLPNRFVECNVLQSLSNSKNASIENKEECSKSTPIKKIPIVVISPLKTPKTNLNSSLNAKRPKRISRLPSKFDDHSMSPTKFVPVQPAYASTPKIQIKPTKIIQSSDQNKSRSPQKTPNEISSPTKGPGKIVRNKNAKIKTVSPKKASKEANANNAMKTISPNKAPVSVLSTKLTKTARLKESSDTNNNAKKDQLPRNRTKNVQKTSPNIIKSGKTTGTKKLINKDYSFKILEDKKKSLKRDASNIDVYEFTYDPNDEPPPKKKKRKRPARKKEPKPKSVVFKNNYDRNLAKVLSALKNTVSIKPVKPIENVDVFATQVTANPVTETNSSSKYTQAEPHTPIVNNSPVQNIEKSIVSEKCYNSVRVEDIALDFEQDCGADDLNYSPINSPRRPITPAVQSTDIPNPDVPVHNNDPLNLQEDSSFFDDAPVASSSMNVSVRHPAASPWRVEFGSLPIKWNVNTYVKPNMTPAFESSFINFNESKKHVYTNMGPDTNEANDLPQIFEENTSKLKQTSIISFIKEVVEKSAKKKKDKMTHIKVNSLFEDLHHSSVYDDVSDKHVTRKKADKGTSNNVAVSHLNISADMSNETESSVETSKEGDKENSKENAENCYKKKKNNELTYFGFDDSENQDQENVSPMRKVDKRRLRALKPRAVLQEINEQKGPTRAAVPVSVKSNTIGSEAANKLFDQMKSATEPPVFSDTEILQSTGSIDITEVQANDNSNDDAQSVHLFEDIEFVHHLKAHRKSYGKTKKAVTFRQNSISDSNVPLSEVAEQSSSSDEDDLHDLTFKVPAMEPKKPARKKKSKKQKLSKKEEKEVEEWAAGFNSMCEDIEEFDLVVE